jgi:hypothetical protein
MDIETATNPVGGEDTADEAILGTETEVDTEAQTQEPELDEYGNPVEAEPEDDSEEIEHDGQKYKVPKALKESFLRQADYTRKTQALAEERKVLETERNFVQQVSQAEISARAEIVSIDQRLAQFQQINWDAWEDQDPFEAQKGWRQFQQLQQARGSAAASLGQLAQQRTLAAQQITATRTREAFEVLKRDIPGWETEVAPKVLDFGIKEFGFTSEELDDLEDPRMVKVLHAAYEARQTQQKQKQAQRHIAAQQVKPAAAVGGRSAPPTGVDDRLSPEEWVRRRNAQVAKKAR